MRTGLPALLTVGLGFMSGPASAGPDAFYYNFYGRFQPPLALPESPRATIRVPVVESHAPETHAAGGDAAGKAGGKPIDTLRDLFPALAGCWQAPQGLVGLEHTEITTRFSLRRDGSIIGTPLVTFSSLPADTRARETLTRATLDALARCTPARITPGLGGAIAGRPLSLRFVYDGPRGRGI